MKEGFLKSEMLLKYYIPDSSDKRKLYKYQKISI